MPTFTHYRHYFDIDPDYFPAVNEAVINTKPDLWKKFFPHETFIKLIKDTIRVLSRQQKMCVWVEGAYGTGKSHAVLTLKKLLDANESDTRQYFEKYGLDKDYCNKLQNLKNSGRILTVHRYGSSKIYNDDDLVFAIQESIEKTFENVGIENKASSSFKNSAIKFLENSENKQSFNIYAKGSFKELFGGDDADAIITKLKTYEGESLHVLMSKLFSFGKHHPILSINTTDLADWIKETIKANSLSAIVFIWDEFTEYFKNNRNLTGFQELCEISETDPFYFILVTHVSTGLFSESNQEYKKLNGRFVAPHSLISLPENIAFQLMGTAMEKNPDTSILADWEEITDDLKDRTCESRKLVKTIAKINDNDLKSILPIHPYTALLLKHISTAFDSNQRSMFDFIKNDHGEEIKGFQWFIDNYGPENENPLLTIDMLWDFFYEKGRDYLAISIRSILDYYTRVANHGLSEVEKRVLKAVLLLQAISQQAGDSIDLFIPNEKNVNNAFEGSDLDGTAAYRCAEKLVRDKVIFKKQLSNNKFQYNAYINEVSNDELEGFKKEIDKKSTSSLITELLVDNTSVADAVKFDGALGLRYDIKFVSSSDFDTQLRQVIANAANIGNKIVAFVCMAKNDEESLNLCKKINNSSSSMLPNSIFIDASKTPFGNDAFEQYRENMAYSMYYQGKDNAMAKQYANNAKDFLKKWKFRLINGEFVVYSPGNTMGERVATVDSLANILKTINNEIYRNCLEGNFDVLPTMYNRTALKLGAECGLLQRTKLTFSSKNEATKLEKALEGAWNVDNYWDTKPNLLISKIKIEIDSIVKRGFDIEGRITIREIYDYLKQAPYGFMPCNFSAFVLGFVLKEYVNGAYNWSDSITNDVLDVTKLQEMIAEIINLQVNDNPRYKDKYIVAMTKEEKAFSDISSRVFDIPLKLCSSVEQTRERIREKMKTLSFPIWSLKYLLDDCKLNSNRAVVEDLIHNFIGIANNGNMVDGKTDNDIAMTIGRIVISNPEACEDLKKLVNTENCINGMKKFIATYEDGALLHLSQEISDNGQYVNVLRKKFDADAANWVWNIETGKQKISEVILDYRIIAESNKIIGNNITIENTIHEWCSKCSLIKISYFSLKDVVNDLKPFLDMLYNIKKSGLLLDSNKQRFLELLQINKDAYLQLQNNQVDYFKRVCSFYLVDFSDDDINKILLNLKSDCFTLEKSEYLSLVESKANSYKSNLKSESLKAFWREKTQTDSPLAWSEKNVMPILCLIPDSEKAEAQNAFEVLNKKSSENAAVEKSIEYLKKATFFDILNNKEELDKVFLDKIVKGSLSVILSDIDKIKEYLTSCVTASPYDWSGYASSVVESKLRELAEDSYARDGYNKAWQKIDDMDDAAVKKYLKNLIKDNMTVGIEIIKDN